MAIRVLDRDVAGKIAAGEVVQRPSSVVKELLENAIDAGARHITVEIEAGGQRVIRVVDDGAGMAAADLPLAVQRYATSKIASEDDLEHIETLGFRGEALPSIAAVSRLSIVTRAAGQQAGMEIRVEGGEVVDRRTVGSAPGTSVTVRNLFYNTPARLKFMRSQSSESGHIATVVCQYALAYPEIQFRLVDDGRRAITSPGKGSLLDAIANLYGTEVAEGLVPLQSGAESITLGTGSPASEDEPEVRVGGFTSKPSLSRSSRAQISFFVNGRWVQNRMLTYALEEAYHSLLPQGRHPVAVVRIELDPRLVDVNVHPAKVEVRFVQERQVFGAVQRAVRAAATTRSAAAELRPPDGPSIASITDEMIQRRLALSRLGLGPSPDVPANQVDAGREPQATEPNGRALPILRVLGQMAATYIVAEGPDGMYLIDQHTAHERILYERLLEKSGLNEVKSQLLLQPAVVELPASTGGGDEIVDLLTDLGFEVEPFGSRTILVRAIPSALALDAGAVSSTVMDALSDPELGENGSNERQALAASLACHSAVRAGQVLTNHEMQRVVADLEQVENPLTCPHGRPTTLHMSQALLEKQFGRR